MAVNYNQVGWFEIPVLDMKRAMDFYEYVFGVVLDEQEMGELKMSWFPMKEDEAGAPGSLVKGAGYVPSDKGTLIYFTSPDIDDTCRKTVEKGGHVLQEKSSIGEYGFVAMVLDTEGNAIGLHSRT
ncbi:MULTISPECIES: VOC family protein [Prosthecochloris]|uniref:Glyoxalase n=1 Tax=Prosthecochloris marina TaxID=2017681 RepID=A0A317T4C0_9CHLB|nr:MULTISPECIES: VOC family protein [Prosthecochloris]PWW81488.1 glyoxalase [Prosthecochloris marina]UZJ38239.1 VOC family protein [Prosthecochloris sp. SCSIO W1103]